MRTMLAAAIFLAMAWPRPTPTPEPVPWQSAERYYPVEVVDCKFALTGGLVIARAEVVNRTNVPIDIAVTARLDADNITRGDVAPSALTIPARGHVFVLAEFAGVDTMRAWSVSWSVEGVP